ncbi:MAG: hypothetical protein U5K76_16040 [Woeseiaceae bacterium]|nr:hypothetical protein [Woeseiaceae bacterium]
MIRRLNYTGRRKIARSRVTVRLRTNPDGGYAFSADYDLSGLRFPKDARVYIEAYNVVSYMRFDLGTVAAPREPKDTWLTELSRRPLPKFRLKVVDRTKRYGLMLGVADKLLPLGPEDSLEQRQSLLPVDFCDLGDRAWRLDLSDWPVLELNNRLDGVSEAARSAGSFLGLVYPEVLRRVLHDIVVGQDITDPGFDDSDWTSLWLRFAGTLPGVGAPPGGVTEGARSRQREWIEETVQAFCKARQARQRLQTALDKEMR